MPMLVDIAIIGGGPAGVAAALSLRQQMPEATVAIFDARRKTCWKPGEVLPPTARTLLESLGCWSDQQGDAAASLILESYGTASVWGSDTIQEREFLFSMHGNGWRLDRVQFDAMLLERAQTAGVLVHRQATLVESQDGNDGWRLVFAGSTAEAQFVVDASGRTARFAVERGVRLKATDSLAGVFVLFDCRCVGVQDYDTLIEAQENGWWYSTSVPGGTLVVAWMSDTDLIRAMELKTVAHWHSLLAQSTQTRQRVQEATAIVEPMIFSARSQRLSQVEGRGWAAAGDAAMAFDPLSSYGIVKALGSGKMASFVALDWIRRNQDTHARYCGIADAEWEQYNSARRAYYAEEKRWAGSPFWARRHKEQV